MSSNESVTAPYSLAGNWWRIIITPDICFTRFNESILIGHGSEGIEYRGGGREDMDGVWTFHLYCCIWVLITYDWISALYQCFPHGLNLLPMEGEFPHLPNLLNCHHWAVPICHGSYRFVRLGSLGDCFIVSFPFLLFFDSGFGSQWGLHPKSRIL